MIMSTATLYGTSSGQIFAKDRIEAVATVHQASGDDMLSTMETMVCAYNAHDDLVKAAKTARKQLKLWMKDHGQDIASQNAIAAIDAALSAAGA
jgi:ABC-type transport system involved in cytochrome c biogenesis ATPase subunit